MKAFFVKFKKAWVVILNSSLIFFSSYFIYHSEKFQEKISPKKFWERKINTLSTELKQDDIRIKSLKLDFEKEISLATYNEETAEIKAQREDLDVNDIYSEMENEHIQKLSRIKDEIDEITKDEEKVKNNLEKAFCHINLLK